jgi:hypothetical protein
MKQATLVGTSSSSLDIAALLPTQWIAHGATLDVPLTAQVLKAGVPQLNIVVNYTLLGGTAALSAGSAATNTAGYATVTAHVANLSAQVQVSACIAPNNSPCATFILFVTSPSLWTLELVSGAPQVVPAGQSFQPLVMRVTDGSTAANPVMGANVVFNTMTVRIPPGSFLQVDGDTIVQGSATPVILGTATATVATTQDGLASIVPGPGSVQGPCDLLISVTSGPSTAQFDLKIVTAMGNGQAHASPSLYAPRAGLPVAAGARKNLLFAVPDVFVTEVPSEIPANADSTPSADKPLEESTTAESSTVTAESATTLSADCPKDDNSVADAACSKAQLREKQTPQEPPEGKPATSDQRPSTFPPTGPPSR